MGQLWAAKLAGKPLPRPTELPVLLGRPSFAGIVLGIDPSLRGTGLAVVAFHGKEAPQLLGSRTLRFPARLPQAACLGEIARVVGEVVEAHQVAAVALEETIYVQNVQTSLIMGMARGAAIAAAARAGLSVAEYPPTRVKQATVGTGRASKEQVARTVRMLLALAADLPEDESDAAAVALCHAFTCRGA